MSPELAQPGIGAANGSAANAGGANDLAENAAVDAREIASRAHKAFAAALGDLTLLMMQSPAHRHVFLNELESTLLPPLTLSQCRIFYAKGRPVAAALWARVSDEVDQRLTSGSLRLKPNEWKSGENTWLIDIVAPGLAASPKALNALVATLAKDVLKGPFKFSGFNPKSGKRQVRMLGVSSVAPPNE